MDRALIDDTDALLRIRYCTVESAENPSSRV